MQNPVVVWYRDDLRISDHPALTAAAESGKPVVALYVLDDETSGEWRLGGASRWWLHHSLTSLSAELARLGCQLVLRRGEATTTVIAFASEVKATAVYCSRQYMPWAATQEKTLKAQLGESGIAFHRFAGTLLHDPDELRTKTGGPFKVYTPFWRALSATDVRRSLKAPRKVHGTTDGLASEALDAWQLLPHKPDWAGGLRDTWRPGDRAAQRQLKAFLSHHGHAYRSLRDRPDLAATSRLSPHLRFGEITPAQCWHAALMQEAESDATTASSLEVFHKELVWREFSYHLLHHWPAMPTKPIRANFEKFPWTPNSKATQLWQRGQTGYPIVDAGMRELWHTGWMHNRVRMIVASFLTKHLRQPWQVGEEWFWDCLVDADLASNAASWQWVAGCGADAAPYFRIFNPIIQGEKFDPDGAYVRRWIPELASLPTKHLFAPWTAPEQALRDANVKLGETYPMPIVDHPAARAEALAAYDLIKGS